MNPEAQARARQVLRDVIREGGVSLAKDPAGLGKRLDAQYGARLCSERCIDLLQNGRLEIGLLVQAAEWKFPEEIRGSPGGRVEVRLQQLARRMHGEQGTNLELARWAIESWALALHVATESQLRAGPQLRWRLSMGSLVDAPQSGFAAGFVLATLCGALIGIIVMTTVSRAHRPPPPLPLDGTTATLLSNIQSPGVLPPPSDASQPAPAGNMSKPAVVLGPATSAKAGGHRTTVVSEEWVQLTPAEGPVRDQPLQVAGGPVSPPQAPPFRNPASSQRPVQAPASTVGKLPATGNTPLGTALDPLMPVRTRDTVPTDLLRVR